jgi:type IV pilus assembly protein PilW
MSRDIRRAGYWQLADDAGQPAGNLTLSGTTGAITVTSSATPFLGSMVTDRTLITEYGAATITGYTNTSQITATVTRTFSTTTIDEGEWMISNLFTETANDLAISADGTCIQYRYDNNGDATMDDNEKFAFRVSSGVVQMYRSPGTEPNCTSGAGNWVDVTSDDISIDTLTFSNSGNKCINVMDDDSDCNSVTPSSGNVLMQIRQVDITLIGSLASSATTTRTLTESVRLRNDRISVY